MILAVPQGTVLALHFLIIMIADIDEIMKLSISRLFTYDTKAFGGLKTTIAIGNKFH